MSIKCVGSTHMAGSLRTTTHLLFLNWYWSDCCSVLLQVQIGSLKPLSSKYEQQELMHSCCTCCMHEVLLSLLIFMIWKNTELPWMLDHNNLQHGLSSTEHVSKSVNVISPTSKWVSCSINRVHGKLDLWQGQARDKDSNARPQESVVANEFIDNQKSQNSSSIPILVLTLQKRYTILTIQNNKQYLLTILTLSTLTTWDNLENNEQNMLEH